MANMATCPWHLQNRTLAELSRPSPALAQSFPRSFLSHFSRHSEGACSVDSQCLVDWLGFNHNRWL